MYTLNFMHSGVEHEQNFITSGQYLSFHCRKECVHTLMNQLIESMLSIGSRLSPNNWSSLIVDTLSTTSHIFPITLHVTLLEISRKPMHILEINIIQNIRIYHECEGRIEKSVRGSPFGITKLAE